MPSDLTNIKTELAKEIRAILEAYDTFSIFHYRSSEHKAMARYLLTSLSDDVLLIQVFKVIAYFKKTEQKEEEHTRLVELLMPFKKIILAVIVGYSELFDKALLEFPPKLVIPYTSFFRSLETTINNNEEDFLSGASCATTEEKFAVRFSYLAALNSSSSGIKTSFVVRFESFMTEKDKHARKLKQDTKKLYEALLNELTQTLELLEYLMPEEEISFTTPLGKKIVIGLKHSEADFSKLLRAVITHLHKDSDHLLPVLENLLLNEMPKINPDDLGYLIFVLMEKEHYATTIKILKQLNFKEYHNAILNYVDPDTGDSIGHVAMRNEAFGLFCKLVNITSKLNYLDTENKVKETLRNLLKVSDETITIPEDLKKNRPI